MAGRPRSPEKSKGRTIDVLPPPSPLPFASIPEGAGPSLPPPGIPRGGGSSSLEGPRSYLLSPINPSSVEGAPLLTPLIQPRPPPPAPQPWGRAHRFPFFRLRLPPPFCPPGSPDIPPNTCPCSLGWHQSWFHPYDKISVFPKKRDGAKQKSKTRSRLPAPQTKRPSHPPCSGHQPSSRSPSGPLFSCGGREPTCCGTFFRLWRKEK